MDVTKAPPVEWHCHQRRARWRHKSRQQHAPNAVRARLATSQVRSSFWGFGFSPSFSPAACSRGILSSWYCLDFGYKTSCARTVLAYLNVFLPELSSTPQVHGVNGPSCFSRSLSIACISTSRVIHTAFIACIEDIIWHVIVPSSGPVCRHRFPESCILIGPARNKVFVWVHIRAKDLMVVVTKEG
jgi:hypothetical protein